VVCRFHFDSPSWFGFWESLYKISLVLNFYGQISGGYGRERLLQTSILTKTKTCLFRLRRGKFLSAKRADIQGRRRGTDEQRQPLPLYRHLSADGTDRAVTWRARTEEACPPAKPLVQSLHSVPAHWVAIVAAVAPKRPVKSFDDF
jgi:hypothetical protein